MLRGCGAGTRTIAPQTETGWRERAAPPERPITDKTCRAADATRHEPDPRRARRAPPPFRRTPRQTPPPDCAATPPPNAHPSSRRPSALKLLNVSDDLPAFLARELRRIRRHPSGSVGDHVEKRTGRERADGCGGVRRRIGYLRHQRTVAIAVDAVAHGAERFEQPSPVSPRLVRRRNRTEKFLSGAHGIGRCRLVPEWKKTACDRARRRRLQRPAGPAP